MTSIIKGGVVIIPEIDATLARIFANINTVANIGANSVGGYLFMATLNQPYRELSGGKPNVISDVNNILIKLIQISTDDDMYQNKEVVTTATFMNEVNTQIDIFKRSLDVFIEPICPGIIYSGIVDIGEIPTNNNRFNAMLNVMRDFINGFNQHLPRSFGIIIMENGGAGTVETIIPEWHHDTPIPFSIPYDTLPFIDGATMRKRNAMLNYLYQILRLKQLGYIHGDAHLGNALCLENYTYIHNMRVFLIDFGRTTITHTPGMELDEILPDQGGWWSYQFLRDFAVNIIAQFGSLTTAFEHYTNTYVTRSNISFLKRIHRRDTLDQLMNFRNRVMIIEQPTNYRFIAPYNSSFIFQYLNPNNFFDITIGVQRTTLPILMANDKPDRYVFYRTDYTLEESRQLFQDPEIRSDYLTLYINEQFPYTLNAFSQIYLWVIGSTADNLGEVNLYMLKAPSSYGIGSFHEVILQGYNLTRYYAAGEMRVTGNIIMVNLCSYYMQHPDVLPHVRIDRLSQILPMFMSYRINRNKISGFTIQMHVRIVETFFRPDYCGQTEIIQQEKRFLQRVSNMFASTNPIVSLIAGILGGINKIDSYKYYNSSSNNKMNDKYLLDTEVDQEWLDRYNEENKKNLEIFSKTIKIKLASKSSVKTEPQYTQPYDKDDYLVNSLNIISEIIENVKENTKEKYEKKNIISKIKNFFKMKNKKIKTRSNKTRSNKTHSNKTHSNKTHSNKTHSNKTRSNKTHSNKTHSNKTRSNKTRSNKTLSNYFF